MTHAARGGFGSRLIDELVNFDPLDYLKQKSKRRWDLDYTIDVIRTMKNWPQVLSEDRADGSALRKYRLREGVSLNVRPKSADRDVVLEIWSRHSYTPPGFEIMPDDTVVDIGAHIGTFAVFASKKASRGKVYCFEPVPENFELLSRNLKENAAENVVAFNKAIARGKGHADIFLSNANTGGHSLLSSFGGGAGKTSVRVETISMKDLISDNSISKIDFLKMDCEGAEYEILYSCSDKELKAIRKISMEYHDLDDRKNGKALRSFLESSGFTVKMDTHRAFLLYASRIDRSSES